MSERIRLLSLCACWWLLIGLLPFWTIAPGLVQEPIQIPPKIDSIAEAAELTEPFEIGETTRTMPPIPPAFWNVSSGPSVRFPNCSLRPNLRLVPRNQTGRG